MSPAPPPPTPDGRSMPPRLTSADLASSPRGAPLEPLVLLADDQCGVVEPLTRLLAHTFPVLEPVCDLPFLERVAPLVAPLVLVCDLDFGGTFATGTIQRLTAVHPALRVIAWSGYDDDVTRQLAAGAGASAFVSKYDGGQRLPEAIAAEREALREAAAAFARPDRLPVASGPRSRRKRHDAGAVVRWALASGFKQAGIAEVVGCSTKAVEYHGRKR